MLMLRSRLLYKVFLARSQVKAALSVSHCRAAYGRNPSHFPHSRDNQIALAAVSRHRFAWSNPRQT